MTQSAAVPVHPVDERLPLPKLFTLGLQHVLVMYAGAVAVPLIIGGALKMSVDQIAFLINADLFACGIATLIQTLGLWIFGLRLPIMMGVTFTAVTPMIAIGTNPELGLLDIYGATIAAGVIGIFIAPFIGKLLRRQTARLSRALDLLPVLVGAGQKSDIPTVQPHESRQHITRYGRVSVT